MVLNNKIDIKSIRFTFVFILCLFLNSTTLFSQQQVYQRHPPETPEYFIPKNHNPNIKSLPQKSFYQSRDDWQYIIDTTWGPGVPLGEKLLIYNTYAQKVRDEFDGFISLGLDPDSLYYHYLPEITESTSAGAFAAIMAHFAYDLRDLHTRATYKPLEQTPLNPGIPLLVLGSYTTVEHFGAVTTVLPDSTTLVLRVVPNHPLNIEPGDIILGYEGIPWKNLVYELLDAGLPFIGRTGGCNSAKTYLDLSCAGMNWHLFSTIDILKHSTGDTVHLSVAPLLNLNVPPMVNNEQLPIDNIPFPDVLSDECVTYGILNNTNIGYIYLAMEQPTSVSDAQFYEAVDSLRNTDALIIDMRLNYGGWALFSNAFNILFNDSYKTIEDAYRCNSSSFQLCPTGDWELFSINGMRPDFYDRPIAVLLGPTCVSMGDITAQRFRYQPMVNFFGKCPDASMGDNVYIYNFSQWTLRYSICDDFHINEPGVYLNRSEFPIDFPIWHNPEDVANGKDAVVDKALNWINNIVYAHNISTDTTYYLPGIDTVRFTTSVENPNSHQLSVRAYLETTDGVLTDSLDFSPITVKGEQWSAVLHPIADEECFKVSVSAIDQTDSTSFTTVNAARFTTAGPVIIDSVTAIYNPLSNTYSIRPSVRNDGQSDTVENITVSLSTDDSSVTSVSGILHIASLAPGENIVPGSVMVKVDSSFSGIFNFYFDMASDGWLFWKDTMLAITTGTREKTLNLLTYNLDQNYPNPFNPETKIKYSIPKRSKILIKVFDVLGREMIALVNEEKPAGTYEVTWNAANLPSGIYFYQLKAGDFIQAKKMILLK